MPNTIDLVVLDGSKALYLEILSLLESRLKFGAIIVTDAAEYSADYLDYIRSPANGYLSIPIAEGIELSIYYG